MASSVNNSAWLEWMTTLMGGVSRQTYAATLPPDRFYCLLDELPLHLIPQPRREHCTLEQGQLSSSVSESECLLCPAGQLPDELADRARNCFRGLLCRERWPGCEIR